MDDENHIKKIAESYDQDVDDFREGIDSESKIPDSIRQSEAYKSLQEGGGGNSGSPEVKEFLSPQAGMKFLDIGSCANLFSYDLDTWPSQYYGVDISPKLVESMKKVAASRRVNLGELVVADMAHLPYKDGFLDIAAAIGVLEYYDLEYIEKALVELHRVVKGKGRVVVDIANLDHSFAETMLETERLKGRVYPDNMPTRNEFEGVLKRYFLINKVSDSGAMIMYFLENL